MPAPNRIIFRGAVYRLKESYVVTPEDAKEKLELIADFVADVHDMFEEMPRDIKVRDEYMEYIKFYRDNLLQALRTMDSYLTGDDAHWSKNAEEYDRRFGRLAGDLVWEVPLSDNKSKLVLDTLDSGRATLEPSDAAMAEKWQALTGRRELYAHVGKKRTMRTPQKIKYQGATYSLVKADRGRTAKELPMSWESIRNLINIDMNRLLRSAAQVRSFKQAKEFERVVNRFGDVYYSVVVRQLLNSVRSTLGDVGLSYSEIKKMPWIKQMEAQANKVAGLLRYYFSPHARKGETEQQYLDRFHRKGYEYGWPELKRKVQYHSRKVFNPFKKIMEIVPDAIKKYPIYYLEDSPQAMEGFNVVLRGFGDEQEYQHGQHLKWLDYIRAALKQYKQKAYDKFRDLLKDHIPLLINFDIAGVILGKYTPADPKIVLYPQALKGAEYKNVMRAVQVIAHEMAHHLYRTALNDGERDFWCTAIKQDWTGKLDLQYILDNWHGSYKNRLRSQDDHFLKKGDVRTYLQLEGLYQDPEGESLLGMTKTQIEDRVRGGDRYVNVPAHPISGYARKNCEESFCEAFGNWFAYGNRAVYPIVRSWLNMVLPEARVSTAKVEAPKKIKFRGATYNLVAGRPGGGQQYAAPAVRRPEDSVRFDLSPLRELDVQNTISNILGLFKNEGWHVAGNRPGASQYFLSKEATPRMSAEDLLSRAEYFLWQSRFKFQPGHKKGTYPANYKHETLGEIVAILKPAKDGVLVSLYDINEGRGHRSSTLGKGDGVVPDAAPPRVPMYTRAPQGPGGMGM